VTQEIITASSIPRVSEKNLLQNKRTRVLQFYRDPPIFPLSLTSILRRCGHKKKRLKRVRGSISPHRGEKFRMPLDKAITIKSVTQFFERGHNTNDAEDS